MSFSRFAEHPMEEELRCRARGCDRRPAEDSDHCTLHLVRGGQLADASDDDLDSSQEETEEDAGHAAAGSGSAGYWLLAAMFAGLAPILLYWDEIALLYRYNGSMSTERGEDYVRAAEEALAATGNLLYFHIPAGVIALVAFYKARSTALTCLALLLATPLAWLMTRTLDVFPFNLLWYLPAFLF